MKIDRTGFLDVLIMAAVGVAVVIGCAQKSEPVPAKPPSVAERTGAAVGRAAEKTVEVITNAAGQVVEKTGEVLERTGDAVEKTGENMQK